MGKGGSETSEGKPGVPSEFPNSSKCQANPGRVIMTAAGRKLGGSRRVFAARGCLTDLGLAFPVCAGGEEPPGPNWEASYFHEVADIAPVPGIDNRGAARLALELSTAERIGF